MNKIKIWWNAEREDRFEKGTSQDMCPTNGDSVIFASIMLFISLITILVMYLSYRK